MSRQNMRSSLLSKISKDAQTFSTQVYLFKQQIAERLGLYPTDFQCINILDQRGPLSAGLLAQELGLTTGATTTLIDRLVSAGYVERLPDATDKRKVMVILGGPALKTMRGIFKPMEKQLAHIWEAFTDEELVAISKYLERMTTIKSK